MRIITRVIDDLAVTEAKVASNAISTDKIVDLAITEPKLGDDSVIARTIADGVVAGNHLTTNAFQSVLESKLFTYAVKGLNLAAGSGNTVDATDFILSRLTTKRIGAFEGARGLITAPPDNRVELREVNTNDPIQTSNDEQVYARQTAVETPLTGTSLFTQGSNQVVGTGTVYLSQLSANDYIKLDSDGVIYQITSVDSDSLITLDENYTGTTGSGATSKVEIILSFYKDVTGTETSHTMSGETIDIIFPEVFDLYNAPFNAPLVQWSFAEVLSSEHNHDTRYHTQSNLASTSVSSGGTLIGIDSSGLSWTSAGTLQAALADVGGTFSRVTRRESITIVTNNVIPDLSFTPLQGIVWLDVAGVSQRQESDYTVSGVTITWVPGTAGFDLLTGDIIQVYYMSS